MIALSLTTCQNLKEDQVSEQHEIDKLVIAAVAGTPGDAAPACEVSATSPAFSTLSAAGVGANCDSCHGGSAPKAGLVTSDYNSMTARVVKGDAANSVLYQKVTTGSMKTNSDAVINQAIFDWIQGCAAP